MSTKKRVSAPRLRPDDWDEIVELVVEGYRRAAPASLAKKIPNRS